MWHILGIEPTANKKDIKRAYAAKLKTTSPEDDPEGFQELRNAYEWALQSLASDNLFTPQVVATPKHIEMNESDNNQTQKDDKVFENKDEDDINCLNPFYASNPIYNLIPSIEELNEDETRTAFLASLDDLSFEQREIIETHLADFLSNKEDQYMNACHLAPISMAEIDSYFSWSRDDMRLSKIVHNPIQGLQLANYLSKLSYLDYANLTTHINLCLNGIAPHLSETIWQRAISTVKNYDPDQRHNYRAAVLKLFLDHIEKMGPEAHKTIDPRALRTFAHIFGWIRVWGLGKHKIFLTTRVLRTYLRKYSEETADLFLQLTKDASPYYSQFKLIAREKFALPLLILLVIGCALLYMFVNVLAPIFDGLKQYFGNVSGFKLITAFFVATIIDFIALVNLTSIQRFILNRGLPFIAIPLIHILILTTVFWLSLKVFDSNQEKISYSINFIKEFVAISTVPIAIYMPIQWGFNLMSKLFQWSNHNPISYRIIHISCLFVTLCFTGFLFVLVPIPYAIGAVACTVTLFLWKFYWSDEAGRART
ncbi:MAG: J domain-containing protein [Methylocystaceae bacterium]|nr:J domain-containing protein [Methylocystaceae bacterium]